ncbi:MAG: hypothetical protein GY809_32080, partial [Planctomycetes bacterium]|nr:hypothetical protein [Planctomycetota bacterium]
DTPSIILFETKAVHNAQCNVLLSTGALGQMPLEELKQYVPLPQKP